MDENNMNTPENLENATQNEEEVKEYNPKSSCESTEENETQDFSLFEIKEKLQESKTEKEPMKNKSKRKKKKGKSPVKSIVWMISIVVIALVIALSAIVLIADVIGIGKEVTSDLFYNKNGNTTVLITVEEGQSVNEIASLLEENNLILNKNIFKAYIKLTGKGNDMNYGVHSFTLDMGYDAILESLAEPAMAEDLEVTIKSAVTVEEIADYLEKKNVCKKDEFLNEIKYGKFDSELWNNIPKDANLYMVAEGYLYPDTYRFYENDSAHRVIQKMLDNLEEKFTPKMREDAKKMGYTTHEVMSLASMVETESCGFYNEMSGVSAVFHNRLNEWPKGQRFLQSDPSMGYAGGERYNTYKTEGIPVGPISNVTDKAIIAAIYPDADNDAYYFVTDKYGKFYYNKTLAAHESTISNLKSRGIWYSKY
ncbi:MAG: endolytic transglycosylase MltG [Clostridia bacterium]|nr:endolytic transglycosylase MltG [Clostridia bacterium]